MRVILIFVGLVAIWPAAALSCSPAEGEFDTPSNFELVGQADLIVLGRIAGAQAEGANPADAMLSLQPVEVLKGDLPAEPLLLPGMLDWNGHTIAPIITPLAENHFSAGLGGCVRMFYQPDELVLAILEDRKGAAATDEVNELSLPRFLPLGDPSSRSVESVANSDDIWVEAVRFYIRQENAGGDMSESLNAALEVLRDQNDFTSNAIANDIAMMRSEERPQFFWDAFNTPAFAMALLVDTDQQRQFGLVCAPELRSPAFVGQEQHSLALRIGQDLFEAAQPELLDIASAAPERATMPATYQSLLLQPDEVLTRLTAQHEEVAVLVGGEQMASAPPGDVLLRWAQRCQSGF